MILDLVAQGFLVGVLGFLDGGQEVANFAKSDGDAFPFHVAEPVVLWLSGRFCIRSLAVGIVGIVDVTCRLGGDAPSFACPLRRFGLFRILFRLRRRRRSFTQAIKTIIVKDEVSTILAVPSVGLDPLDNVSIGTLRGGGHPERHCWRTQFV